MFGIFNMKYLLIEFVKPAFFSSGRISRSGACCEVPKVILKNNWY